VKNAHASETTNIEQVQCFAIACFIFYSLPIYPAHHQG
jgi:hypothetical protein